HPRHQQFAAGAHRGHWPEAGSALHGRTPGPDPRSVGAAPGRTGQALAEDSHGSQPVGVRPRGPGVGQALRFFENDMSETSTATKKVYIKTYGCQMNEYDSDKMSDVMN